MKHLNKIYQNKIKKKISLSAYNQEHEYNTFQNDNDRDY